MKSKRNRTSLRALHLFRCWCRREHATVEALAGCDHRWTSCVSRPVPSCLVRWSLRRGFCAVGCPRSSSRSVAVA